MSSEKRHGLISIIDTDALVSLQPLRNTMQKTEIVMKRKSVDFIKSLQEFEPRPKVRVICEFGEDYRVRLRRGGARCCNSSSGVILRGHRHVYALALPDAVV